MTDNKKSLTLNGMTGPHTLYVLLSFAMIGVSVYLTRHYFNVHFPTGFGSENLCTHTGFFSCDAATNSIFAQVLNVPTSFFGIMVGVCFLFGSIMPSPALEKTNNFIAVFNAIGCFFLMVYSLVALGHLCPYCTVYYVLSWIVLYLFWKNGGLNFKAPDLKVFSIMGVVFLTSSGIMASVVADKKKKSEGLRLSLIKDFRTLKIYDSPTLDSNLFIHKAKGEEKIRMSLFSDFQCPACESLSAKMADIIKGYEDVLTINYYFYPLDSNCNKHMQRQLHPQACQAAYISACKPEIFDEVHDHIFENQSSLSNDWLDDYAKDLGVTECSQKPEMKNLVEEMIELGHSYKVKGTPTIVLNNRVIAANLPAKQWHMLFDFLLNGK